MSFLHTLAAFAVAILLLVSLHELGHLLVARWCGIKVLRFSVGFGKPFAKKTWRGIEWCFAPIPLGGYVKMADTREGDVPEADLPHAFDKQHPLKRIAVVLAGPLVNLALAVLLFAVSFSLGGVRETKPYVGTVHSPSIAAAAGFEAGDLIKKVNGRPVSDFAQAQTEIILDLEAGRVRVDVLTAQGQAEERVIAAAGSPEAEAVARRQAGLGIAPFKLSDNIGHVVSGSPAAKAGLRPGDRIMAMDGQSTPAWEDWSQIVRANAGRNLNTVYRREGKLYQTVLLPESHELPDRSQIIGRIGVAAAPDEKWQNFVSSKPYYPALPEALSLAAAKTADYSLLTLKFFGKLLLGQASTAHISGPIAIAEIAGQTASINWQAYVEFLALVSMSLGVMNLLPVPLLDGGHLVYYTAELIRGKPLSQRVQEIGTRLGLAAIMTMMLLAFANDLTRLFN